MQNVADACALGMLIAHAFADGGEARAHLSVVGRFVEKRFRHDKASAVQRDRFSTVVERCVREHAGETDLLERALPTLDPAMNAFDADALGRVMRSLVTQVKRRSSIAAPLMAAKVAIAIDVFGDRSAFEGSGLTAAEIEDRVHKRFLNARGRARKR